MYGIRSYLLTGAGVLVLVLGFLLWNADRRLDNARVEIAQMKTDVATAVHANTTMRQTLDLCKEVNDSNAQARDEALKQAQDAQARVQILAGMLDEELRNGFEMRDEGCRALDDPLPADFVDWLCIDQADNCN